MANLALVSSTPADAIVFSANPGTGSDVRPGMAWPASGGSTHGKINAGVYVVVVAPAGSIAAGGPTTGQLFPVGNR
jgi:hypothetical protein